MKRFAHLRLLALALAAALAAGPLAAATAAPSLKGKKALFVIQMNGKDRSADDAIRKHLEAQGLVVALADQAEPESKAAGQDLVVVSTTVEPRVVAGKYKETQVPVITFAAGILGDMAMTGKKENVDFGAFEEKDHYAFMVNAPHPLAGKLPAGTFVATGKNVPIHWGKPALAASVITTLPGYFDKPVIFSYDKGATMHSGYIAPARRVGFFLANVFSETRPETHALLNAALRWSVESGNGATNSAAARADVGKGKSALLVVQTNSTHPKAEVRQAMVESNARLKAQLDALGFKVTVVDMAEPATRAAGMNLVVISSTVKANVLGGRYRNVTVPIVNFENDVLDDLGMTAKRRGVDFGDDEDLRAIAIVNAAHPIAAGAAPGTLDIFSKPVGLGWGFPGAGAITIATLKDDPAKAAIFAYEKGATMDYESIAPARRVFLPVDFNAFTSVNEAGSKLIDSAVTWAVAQPGR